MHLARKNPNLVEYGSVAEETIKNHSKQNKPLITSACMPPSIIQCDTM